MYSTFHNTCTLVYHFIFLSLPYLSPLYPPLSLSLSLSIFRCLSIFHLLLYFCLYDNKLCMFWPINFQTWKLNDTILIIIYSLKIPLLTPADTIFRREHSYNSITNVHTISFGIISSTRHIRRNTIEYNSLFRHTTVAYTLLLNICQAVNYLQIMNS